MKPQNLILDVLLDVQHKEIKEDAICNAKSTTTHTTSLSSLTQLPTTPNYSSQPIIHQNQKPQPYSTYSS